MDANQKPIGLALLREPFPPHQISKLPKATKQQTEAVRADFKLGIRCKLCGQWHHKDVVHLDYVGHAALTDRLLDCDPQWNWEPVATSTDGTPLMDGNGGMWIRLTVCGVTRLGYGHPDGKKGGDAIKEVIGDALRNAAMRFGAALDLWHKGDLHGDDEAEEPAPKKPEQAKRQPAQDKRAAPRDDEISHERAVSDARAMIASADTMADLQAVFTTLAPAVKADARVIADKDDRKAALSEPVLSDEIPY